MIKTRSEQYDDFIRRIFHISQDSEKNYGARTVTIQVTDECNLACTYCYQINKCTHVIPLEVGQKFLDDLLDGRYNDYCDYSKAEAIILEFIGGEPFVAIKTVAALTDYFIEGMVRRNHPWLHRFRISICSNGTLYFNPEVQEYIRKHARHLSFSISIDGNKQLHDACRIFPDGSGSYDIAISAVDHYLKTYDAKMGSKMTIAPGNVAFVYDAVLGLVEKGYTEINLNCVYEEGWTLEHAKILYQQLKKIADYLLENKLYEDVCLSIFDQQAFCPLGEEDNNNWCGGTGAMLSVDWKGDLYPCIRYMESSLGGEREPIVIGDVYNGIKHTEKQCQVCDALDCITRRSQSTDECFYCPIARGCSWCSAYNYQCFGTANKRATFICIMHKARALANAYYWNKCYRMYEPNKRFKIWMPEEWALEIIDADEFMLLKVLESALEIE